MGMPPTGSSAFGIRSPVKLCGASTQTAGDNNRVHRSEAVGEDAFDRITHGLGRVALRLPAKRLQA